MYKVQYLDGSNAQVSEVLDSDTLDAKLRKLERWAWSEYCQGVGTGNAVLDYRIVTMKGVSILAFRNSSNGYYGGYCSEISETNETLITIEPDINGVWQAV